MILDWLDSLALTIGPGLACFVFGIGIVLGLPILYLLTAGGFSYVQIVLGEWRLMRMMRRHNRSMSPDDLLAKLNNRNGSIIIERPYLGWGISRIWWTPDDIAVLAPAEPRTVEDFDYDLTNITSEPFTEWAVENYLSERTGKAWLVSVFKSEGLARRFAKRFPRLKMVKVESGLIQLIS